MAEGRKSGSGSNLLKGMDVPSKLHLVDQQADDGVVHRLQLGEADRPPCQPLDPSPEIEVFAFNTLGVAFSHLVADRIEVARVSAPVVLEVPGDIERGEQGLEFF